MPKIFISYRRQDSGAVARRLAETLSRSFGTHQVFIDTDSIRVAQNWKNAIQSALEEASVLIAVIGPQWLRLQNEEGRRRIDLQEDWVRSEIGHALQRSTPIIPLLISGTEPLTESALPDSLAGLALAQAYRLADEYWKRDVDELIGILSELGMRRVDASGSTDDIYPPGVDRSKELTPSEIEEALIDLPEWKIVTRPPVREGAQDRTELHRAFRFRSFPDAVHFMITASRYVHLTDHHPDWQNLWVSVKVWLTTWDIGHKPSFKDVRLAKYLETLYRDYMV